MKLIFSPEYSGNVYVKPADGKAVMMNTVVTNTAGLVGLLELQLGLHYEEVPAPERVAHYYDALCRYMAAHPKNVMAASFETAGLHTAKAMLAWRDELRSAGWNFEGEEISARLAVLVGVENYFRQHEDWDMASRLQSVTAQVAVQQLDCREWVIEMAVDKALLKPATRALFDALEAQGAQTVMAAGAADAGNNLSRVRQLFASKQKGKITLDPKDDSLQIWKFADERLACEYLSYHPKEEVEAWVNADNKQMDNWLMGMGKPLSGSVTADCTPQLAQLFVMGLGLFAQPLNVNTLIEWLNMPVHPLDKFFRRVLAERIASEGGYRNPACRKLIDQFIAGKFVYLDPEELELPEAEQTRIRLKDQKKRQQQVGVFLPPQESGKGIRVEDVKAFVTELSSWARQRAYLMGSNTGNEQWVEQLTRVAAMGDAFSILLGTVDSPNLDYKTLDSWMSTVYEKETYTHAIAEQGCRIVVDAPAKMASVARTTVWIGVDGDAGQGKRECAFLYPSEKEQLTQKNAIQPWKENSENHYHEQAMMTPLRMTQDQLILVVRERVGGEPTQKHPLIVRLEQQVDNLEDFVVRPQIGVEDRHKAEVIENGGVSAELHFAHAEQLKWPDHLSPTTIGTLAEHPFDYLMERLLDITHDGKAQMADAKTTKGNVAHAVIEALFAPRNEARYATPEEIATRIQQHYETVYQQVLEEKGAVLQLAENQLAEKLLHEQLRNCLDILLEILKENDLKVTGCEAYVECQMGLGLPPAYDQEGKAKERDMVGIIDMTLEDADGHPVVFDFKWTTWKRGYQEKLAEHRSVQLELYRMMLGRKQHDEVKRVAYFLMPDARLYSQEAFKGSNCHQVTPAHRSNIVEQLKQSALYRKAQLERGIVETNGAYDALQYVMDTDALGLYPLKKNETAGTKEENSFSQYPLFNH